MPDWKKRLTAWNMSIRKKIFKKYIQTKEQVKILLLDQENSGVTQLLEYMGEEETDMYVRFRRTASFRKD